MWDTARWVRLRALHGRHEDTTWPVCMALSSDGALLASGSSGPCGGSTIKVRCCMAAHRTHAPCVLRCARSLSLLACRVKVVCRYARPSHLQVFDTEGVHPGDAGTCLATFAQLGFHEHGDISSLLFSPDASVLYSGASDGTVAAWKLTVVEQRAFERQMRRGFL